MKYEEIIMQINSLIYITENIPVQYAIYKNKVNVLYSFI